MSGTRRSGSMEGHGEAHGRKSRSKDEKSDSSKESLERKVRELQHRLDEERQASRREKLSLARLQREMARQKSEFPFREGVDRELEREKMLRVDSEQRLRDMTIENDSCKGRLRALQEEFKKMEEVVQNMMQYKAKIDQLKQEKSSLAVTYESNLQKYRNQMNCLERENMMLLNEVKKKESQTGCTSDNRDKTKLLLERLRLIEAENSSLVLENEQQRQQYEKCLDEIANQVVQALMGQKTLREECIKLQGRVQDLELQNKQLNFMFQHKMQFTSEPLLQQSFPTSRSQALTSGMISSKAAPFTSVSSLPTHTSTHTKPCPLKQSRFSQIPNPKRHSQDSSKTGLPFLRDSAESLKSMCSDYNFDDSAGFRNRQSDPSQSWLREQLGLAGIPSGAFDSPVDSQNNGTLTPSDPNYHRHSNGHIATPGSMEKRFRMKIETEFPASSNSSPKMKHVGIVSCGPMENTSFSAGHSRASSTSALSIGSLSNQNLSNFALLNDSDSLRVRKLYNREEGVKSPGWEWVSPTGSRHDNQPFLSPIDDCSDDDESVRMTHEFSSASTMSLNEILDDRLGMEVEESEMEETHSSSMDNFSIPASTDASMFFSVKPGLNSLSGVASFAQTSSPDSDSGVHTPCMTSPVRIEDKPSSLGPHISVPSTSTPYRAPVSIPTPMQTNSSSTTPERPQSLELRKNGSTSTNHKTNVPMRSIIPKRKESMSSSLPLAKSRTENIFKSSKSKSDQSQLTSLKYNPKSTNHTESSSSGNSKYGARSSVGKTAKASALPRKISTNMSKRPPDVLPPNVTSAPSNSAKRNYKLPERNRTVVIASAMTDPNHISKAFEYCANNSTYVPGIDTPTVPRETVLMDPLCGNSCNSFVYKNPSISSDSSSESIRVERSGSKDDGYSTMSSDVHPEVSDKYNDGTVKRNAILKQDSSDHTSVSPCFTDESSPSPVLMKPPPKPSPKPSQMPVALRRKAERDNKKACPPLPPPKPSKQSPRKPSKLPLPRSAAVSKEIVTISPPVVNPVPVTPSPTQNRVRQMAKMFETNAVSEQPRPLNKKNRYSFHGDFNICKKGSKSDSDKNFRHSYDGSVTMPIEDLSKQVSQTDFGAKNEVHILTCNKSVSVEKHENDNKKLPSPSTCNIPPAPKTVSSPKISPQELSKGEKKVPNFSEEKKPVSKLPFLSSRSIKTESAKVINNEQRNSQLADSIVTDISSKDLLCAALAEEFSSPDSISPISDSSQDSLTQIKLTESDSVENYLMYNGIDSEDFEYQQVCVYPLPRDGRILHDITEESDASQSSAADSFMRRKMGGRGKPSQRKTSKAQTTKDCVRTKQRMFKSLSDSDLHKKRCSSDSWLGRGVPRPRGANPSPSNSVDRSASVGEITVPCPPISSMSRSLRRSPCQLLIDEDTMSQKAAMLLHREHFSDDVYNYSSDSESDFEETINFLALWQQRPKSKNSLPDWNPKETLAEAKKGGPDFLRDLKDFKSSKDVDEWLLQFSDKDIESHLYDKNDSNFILLKNDDKIFENSFDEGSHEASASQCDEVAMVTEEDSEADIDAQTCFRREFYSLCRVGSNKSLCSGSGIMGSDLDLGPLNSGNGVIGTPLENCVQDMCANPSLATGTSNEKMAEFDKISQQIASLSRTVDDLNRSLSSLDSVGGSSGDLRLDDFKPSSTEESNDGFHWVEDDEFYLEPCSGEVMVHDSSILPADDGCYDSDWMNEYAKSSYQEQDEDFHNHLQDLSEEAFLPQHHSAQRRHHGNCVVSPEEMIARDAEARANLLDAMMDFGDSTNSLASSGESDNKGNVCPNPCIKHGAKNFPQDRKPKGKLQVMKPVCVRQRPAIDFATFFTRFEEPEKRAVSAFDFLDNISTSSSEEDQNFDQAVQTDFDQFHVEGASAKTMSPGGENDFVQERYQSAEAGVTPVPFSLSSCKRRLNGIKKRTQTPKLLKQAANLTKRLSNGSLDSQENVSTESLIFSDSCCERYSPSPTSADDEFSAV